MLEPNELRKQIEQKMHKSIDALKQDLAKVRTGRAHTGLLDHVQVEYYGSMVPISQVASVTLIDARTIGVQPWEKPLLQKVEKAIRDADLGLNPASQGELIRVPMPMLTEERRRDMTKLVNCQPDPFFTQLTYPLQELFMSQSLEVMMYQVGQVFLIPTLLVITIMFFYSFYALGAFLVQGWQRKRSSMSAAGRGYPLLLQARKQPDSSDDDLDVIAHKMLETPRLATRIAPMLGLVATMIPMGPALKGLSDGNLAQVSDNLAVAFSAVILALSPPRSPTGSSRSSAAGWPRSWPG